MPDRRREGPGGLTSVPADPAHGPEQPFAGAPRTTRYRLRLGAWGIWVELTASASVGAGVPVTGERVADGVWLDVSPVLAHPPSDRRGKRLTAGEAAWLRHGLALAGPALAARGPGAHTLVTVDRVLFPEADFQPEGLAAALLRWAEEEFGLAPHPVRAHFDRGANRYVFRWPAGQGRLTRP
ncbi:hypothetical protein [Streptomyces sp. NPDC056491]|uniref:hypothetical protein n=1 Tax=Streptomyces sp. NPDC056491 TaxID=3345837 RepID=UPI003685B35F